MLPFGRRKERLWTDTPAKGSKDPFHSINILYDPTNSNHLTGFH